MLVPWYWTNFALDLRVFAFAAGVTGICAALVGLAPALLVWLRTNLSLRQMSTRLVSGRRVPLRRLVLVAVEIQLALVLLAGAGLLGKTFLDAAGRDLGIAKRSVLTVALAGRGTDRTNPAEQRSLADHILERLRGLPGAVAAAARTLGPGYPGLTCEGDAQMIPISPPLHVEAVTADYFTAWSIPLIEGRTIKAADVADGLPVVVLDERTANRLFPEGHAVGRRIAMGNPSQGLTWMTIVGLVATTRSLFAENTDRFYPTLYQPFSQGFSSAYGLRFVVRTIGPSGAMPRTVRAAIADVAPNILLVSLTSMESLMEQQLAPLRLNATVITGLAVIALIIAALGVYGIVAQMVSQRSAEVGLRLALGARPASVVRLMMTSTIAAALVGVVGGLAGALVVTRLIRALLYGTSATDPQVFIWATVVLTATAVSAAYVPARRASRVEPFVALRDL